MSSWRYFVLFAYFVKLNIGFQPVTLLLRRFFTWVFKILYSVEPNKCYHPNMSHWLMLFGSNFNDGKRKWESIPSPDLHPLEKSNLSWVNEMPEYISCK